MSIFTKAIEDNDLEALRRINKSDLHNHATRGGNIRDFNIDVTILQSRNFHSLDDMQLWYDSNIKVLFNGREGFITRIESAFHQALRDGVTRLSLSFGIGDITHFNNTEHFVDNIKRIHSNIAPNIDFLPEISFMRTNNIRSVESVIDEVLDVDYFKSIDLVGDDMEKVDNFKSIYRKAKSKGMILKAHLGEFGDAESIRKGVDILELDQVQHGISSHKSQDVLKWLERNSIQLNICPSSNIMLNRVDSYKEHPIRTIFDQGIKVTINSDDMLIFDQSVSKDYLNLYNSGCMSAYNLEKVLKFGME